MQDYTKWCHSRIAQLIMKSKILVSYLLNEILSYTIILTKLW